MFTRFLLTAAPLLFLAADTGGASGGAPTPEPAPSPAPSPTPTPEPDPAPDPHPPQVAATKPNIFVKAAGMLKDKSELLGTISAHEATIAKLTADHSALTAQHTAAMAELTSLRGQVSEFEATVNGLTEQKKTVEAAAIDQVAALGFDAKKLPAQLDAGAADGDAPTSAADFNKQLNAITDPTARGKFYAKHAKKFGL